MWGEGFEPFHQNLVPQLAQGLWVMLPMHQSAGLIQHSEMQITQVLRLDVAGWQHQLLFKPVSQGLLVHALPKRVEQAALDHHCDRREVSWNWKIGCESRNTLKPSSDKKL